MTVAPVSETAAVNAPVIATTWDLAESVLASKLSSYESRPEQQRLAHAIEKALATGTNLAAQAGTGTGKSFAGLIPAIQRALATGTRVIVATGTIALQGQYTLSDLPFLAEALDAEALGRPFNFAELKGRSNYLCLSKIADAPEVESLEAIARFVEDNPEHSGDVALLPQGMLNPREASKLTATSEECPGATKCQFGESCFAVGARQRALSAEIVVVNHALLAVDLMTQIEEEDEETGDFLGYRSVVLGNYDRVIIDEAHNFEGYVTSMLGAQLTEGTFTSLASDVASFIDGEDPTKTMVGQAKRLFADMGEVISRRETSKRLPDAYANEVATHVASLLAEVQKISTAITNTGRIDNDPKRSSRKARLQKRCANLAEKLGVLAPQVSGANLGSVGQVVRWLQRDGDRITVGYSPLSVAQFLREHLWAQTSGVLLSATLRPNNDADFIPSRLGLDEYQTFDAGTPFDYATQAGIFVDDRLNPQDRASWSGGGHQLTLKAIDAANGRALLLFTSRSEMEARYDALHEELEDMGYACHIQRKGVPVSQLIAAKKADPSSVIFGLKSLMEGISVEGDALRLVILDKLPFPVPSEVVFEARCEQMDKAAGKRHGVEPKDAKFKSGGSFYGLSIPTMSLLLEQSFGRLIRTTSDRGVVVVMDNRISPRKDESGRWIGKGYGRQVFRNLPEAQNLATEREMVKYLRALAAGDR